MRKICFFLLLAFLVFQLAQPEVAYADLGNQLNQRTLELAVSALGGLLVLIVGWATKKYLIPFLVTEKRRRMAAYILLIADEVTDYFVSRYPDQKILTWIDQAVDKIMEITGVEKEVALRAIQASISRKKISYQ